MTSSKPLPVKRDNHFSSDSDNSDDIPLVSESIDQPSPIPSQSVSPIPSPQIFLSLYRITWTSGTFPSAIKQIRFLSDADSWLYTAEPKEIQGIPSYVITEAHNSMVLGRLETSKSAAFTLLLPTERGEIELLGFVWESNGIKFVFCPPGSEPFVSSSKDERLAKLLKDRKPLPSNALTFISKPNPVDEKGKPVRHPELPEVSEPSDKNFVVIDPQWVTIMKIYKMGERFFTVQAIPFLTPLGIFACAIAVIIK
jgi:hypothetical protein